MTGENKKRCWDFWVWLVFCFFTTGSAVIGIWLFMKSGDWHIIFFFGLQILVVIGLAMIKRPISCQISSHTATLKTSNKTKSNAVIVGALFITGMIAAIYLNRDDLVPFVYADRDVGLTKKVYIKNGFFKSRFYVKDKKGTREFASNNLNARVVGAKIALSPDEKRVAILYRYIGNPEIYIIDITDPNSKRLFYDIKRLFRIKEKIKPPLRFFDRNYGCESIKWEDNNTIRFGKIRSWSKWEQAEKGYKMITRDYLLDIASDNSGHKLRIGNEKVEYVKFPQGIF